MLQTESLVKKHVLTLALASGLAALLVSSLWAATPRTDDALARHLLNRLGFGPRPGDIERVTHLGAVAYVNEQLHPERLPDSAVISRLAGFETLALSSGDIAERYEQPAMAARRANKNEAPPDTSAPPEQRIATPEMRLGAIPLQELSQQKIIRAVYSDRQLEEALVDFWFNHFNVDARKGPARFMLTEYEREAIRPFVFGSFRDLLGATAKSPAMLFYLDNWQSAGTPDLMRQAQRLPRRPANVPTTQPAMPRGLNENYARELLELHTLGVDGGYTQKDVTEVARAFTGWTIAGPRQGGGFVFRPMLHDGGPKSILGRTIDEGGERDGEAVLDMLAAHPATARFISTELAKRFVSDTPPAALVNRMAAEFERSRGNLRAVMTLMLTSPEFLSPDVFAAKLKTPFDFVVSALRSTDADIRDARPLIGVMQNLGMPLYQCQPPTGYADSADAWVNTGALVNRMNVALSLAKRQTRGTVLPPDIDAVALIGPAIADTTRATIAKAGSSAQEVALALGAPEFQRR